MSDFINSEFFARRTALVDEIADVIRETYPFPTGIDRTTLGRSVAASVVDRLKLVERINPHLEMAE